MCVQVLCQARYAIDMRDPFSPRRWDPGDAIVSASYLPVDCGRGIRVVAQINCEQTTFCKRRRLMKRPQGRLKGTYHVPSALDGRRLFVFERAPGYRLYFGTKWDAIPNAGGRRVPHRKQFVFRSALNRPDNEPTEVPAGVPARSSAVGCSRAFHAHADSLSGSAREEQGHGSKAHQTTVAGRESIRRDR